MRSDQATLYILSDAPAGDPLDVVAAAMPLLAPHYAAIRQVGPGNALSVRALRRAYEPGVDRLLYDFTAPNDHSWAFDMLTGAPAAILRGGYGIRQGVAQTDLRSARRYAADGLRFSADAMIGVLDATPASSTAVSLQRAATPFALSDDVNDLVLAVAPGAIEIAYAALLELRGDDSPLIVLTATRRDANDLSEIIAAFGMSAAHVRFARDRPGLVAAMIGAGGLIDACYDVASALGDAAFVAGCMGAPVLKLSKIGGAGAAAKAFALGNPRKDPIAASNFAAARPLAGFAGDLHALVEAGFARALTHDAAA